MSKHRGEPVIKYRVSFVESERGWGRSEYDVDYDTREEAQSAIDRTNAQNTSATAPDYYVMAYNTIKEVQL